MILVKDWMAEAAQELEARDDIPGEVDLIRAIIEKHCPFKVDIAYMPVPRCETCRHWNPYVIKNGWSQCSMKTNLRINATGPSPSLLETHAIFGCVQWKAKS